MAGEAVNVNPPLIPHPDGLLEGETMRKRTAEMVITLSALAALNTACNLGSTAAQPPQAALEAAHSSSGTQVSVATTASMAEHPAWVMASNCFQCHGTDGSGGFERLKGMSTSEFIKEMKELQRETETDEAIMKVHALAYTDAEIALMADYFNKAR